MKNDKMPQQQIAFGKHPSGLQHSANITLHKCGTFTFFKATTIASSSHVVSLCAYLIALDNLSFSTQFVQILIKVNSLERYAF